MRAPGYALLFSALAALVILGSNIYSARARNVCESNCPEKPEQLKVYFDLGWFKLRHCGCEK